MRDTGRFAVSFCATHACAAKASDTRSLCAWPCTLSCSEELHHSAHRADDSGLNAFAAKATAPRAARTATLVPRYAVGLAVSPSETETPYGWARQRAGVGRLAAWLAPRSPFRRTAQRPFRRIRPPPQTVHRATLHHGLLSRRPMQGTTPHTRFPLCCAFTAFPIAVMAAAVAPAPPAPWKKKKASARQGGRAGEARRLRANACGIIRLNSSQSTRPKRPLAFLKLAR